MKLISFLFLLLKCTAAFSSTIPTTHYYSIVFANEPHGILPLVGAHTYAEFIKIESLDNQNRLQDESSWEVESFTISWLPAQLPICILCRPVTGFNYSLEQTFQIAIAQNVAIYALPTFEITKEIYEGALFQLDRLQSGRVAYVVNDRRQRPEALNCMHAVTDVQMSAGYIITGVARGLEGSRIALRHLAPVSLRNSEVPAWLASRLRMNQYPVNFVSR